MPICVCLQVVLTLHARHVLPVSRRVRLACPFVPIVDPVLIPMQGQARAHHGKSVRPYAAHTTNIFINVIAINDVFVGMYIVIAVMLASLPTV
jgi:hypothetical protein